MLQIWKESGNTIGPTADSTATNRKYLKKETVLIM